MKKLKQLLPVMENTGTDRHENRDDKSLDTNKLNQTEQQDQGSTKGGIHNNALYAASFGRPATAQVDPHSNSGLANTGTNISYEGPTAPGSGGSAGTGYTSGQADTGQTISTGSDYNQTAMGRESGSSQMRADAEDAENELNEQR